MDVDGHGTHIAGIIGAIGNNGIGVAGITPHVRLLACKFMEHGKGYVQDLIACIKYCVANNATISSNSYRAMLNDTETESLRVRSSGLSSLQGYVGFRAHPNPSNFTELLQGPRTQWRLSC